MSARTHGRHRAADVSSVALLVDAVSRQSAPVVKVTAVAAATTGVLAAAAVPANAAPAAPQAPAPAVATPAITVTAPAATFGEVRFTATAATATTTVKTAKATTTAKATATTKQSAKKHKAKKKRRHTTARTLPAAPSTTKSADATTDTVTSSRSTTRVPLANDTTAKPANPAPQPAPAPAASSGDIIGLAQQYSGIYYVWGGTTPAGFDCSGFTQYLYNQLGVSLPRTAESQRQAVTPVSDPQVGDLVFFGVPAYHVGIYAGDGKMYDSPRTGKTTGLHTIWSSNVTYGRP